MNETATGSLELEELRRRNRELEARLSESTADLAESVRRHRRIFERSKDVIIVSTPTGELIEINPAGLELYGYDSVEEMLSLDLRNRMWANPLDRDEYVAELREFGFVKDFEADHLRRNGEVITVVGTTSIVTDSEGEIVELLTILRDISEQKRLQRELERLARSDSLTGLANRFVFRERLEAAVTAARHGGGGESFALLMLDLDNLKEINDSYGHPAGDTVLIAAAKRFQNILGEADVLARYGGDEFALLLFDTAGERAVTVTAERLVHCLDRPIAVGDRQISTSVSIGVATPTKKDRRADQLLQRADRALYRAKGRGRGRYSL
jgi:diguanylate cyclase (GGDEF)-like protein/PAS domain S-box-containing protein